MNPKYTRLLKYTLRQWRALAAIVGFTAVGSAVAVLEPWPLKFLVDYAFGTTKPPLFLNSLVTSLPVSTTTGLILAAAVMSLGLFALYTALDIALTFAWSLFGERLVYDLAADLFHKFQRASSVFHSKHSAGDSLSRITGDVYCVYGVAQNFLMSPLQHVLTLATVGLIAWRLDPFLAALTLVIAPVQVGTALYFGPRLKRRAEQNRKVESSLASFVHQTLTSIPLIQAFGTEERNGRQFRRLAAESVTLSQRGILLGNAYGIVNDLTHVLANALVLFIGAQRVLSGNVSVGSLLVFLTYSGSMRGALGNLISTHARLKGFEVNVDRVLEILELEPGVREAEGAKPLESSTAGGRGHVRMEKVRFGYEPGRVVLDDVTLEAHPGEIVALVGPTGAGKSTLVSLIPRFFDPWEGQVFVDGMDIRQVEVASLRSQVAIVFQEPFLLPLTVAENIAYARPEASRDEIVAAAIAANAHAFIQRLPEGYDTSIGERGSTLSGGEKQRISIARALLKDAPILILDEPTSALDAGTEALLFEALERLMAGRTTFIIAHRLSTIRNADRIVVIDSGRVAEVGTHHDLLRANGHYRRFHSLQFSGPADKVAQ